MQNLAESCSRFRRLVGGRRLRRGVVLTIEMIIIFPLLIATALIILQHIGIVTAEMRVEAATLEASLLAASSATATTRDIHNAAGVALEYMGGDYFTEVAYIDNNASPAQLDAGVDEVVVAVRVPMAVAATNYIGMLGGSVERLQIRSVSRRRMQVTIPTPACAP